MVQIKERLLKLDIPEYIGLAGLYLFASLAWYGKAAENIGLGLMLVAFVGCFFRHWNIWRREPVFWLTLLFSAYLVIRAYLGAVEIPETKDWQVTDTKNWLYLSLFVLVGWWIRGNTRRVITVLGLSLVGLLLAVLRRHDWSCNGLLDGLRCGYGFQLILFGFICATVILGLLLFAPRILNFSGNRWLAWLGRLVWVAALLVFIQGFISSHARAAWLAAAVVLPGIYFFFLWRSSRQWQSGLRPVFIGGGAFLMLCLLVVAFNIGPIKERLAYENDDIKRMIELDTQGVTGGGSVGARYHLNILGLEKWWDRPIWGWGPGMRSTWYFEDIYTSNVGQRAHLHNSYLEPLVRLGLAGVLLMGLVLLLITRYVLKARADGTMPFDTFMFLVGTSLMLAIWCLADFQLFLHDWRIFWLLLAGVAYSYAFANSEHLSDKERE